MILKIVLLSPDTIFLWDTLKFALNANVMKLLVITGPPYSGKGTQCEILEKQLQYEHLSTGDVVRKEKDNDTAYARKAKEYSDAGELVPDHMMKDLLQSVIEQFQGKTGIILDGYPRTQPQVDTLIELIAEVGLEAGNVINVQVPHDELLKRAGIRAETSNRADDKNVKTRHKRINDFEEQTKPAIEYMRTKFNVIDIDGMHSVEAVTKAINAAL
jgi:adenylate kinase